MTEYDKILETLKEMRSRYDNGFSSSDRQYITHQYSVILGKRVRRSGCSDCYRDAYIELYTHLKRIGKMPNKPNYILKAGVVVHPAGTSNFYANSNIPDEVAEKYLAEYPQRIGEFESYPSDYLARVEARKEGKAVESDNVDVLKGQLKALTEENERLRNLLEKAEESKITAEHTILKLNADLAEAQEALAKATAESKPETVAETPADAPSEEDGAKKTKKKSAEQ